MHQKRIAPRLVVTVLLGLGTLSLNAFAQEAESQPTETPEAELLRWFTAPSRVSDVISTNDSSNFMKSTGFGSRPQSQAEAGAPTPPVPPGITEQQLGTAPPEPLAPIGQGHSIAPPSVTSPYPASPFQQRAYDPPQADVELPPAVVPPPGSAIDTSVPDSPIAPQTNASPGLLENPGVTSQMQAPTVAGSCASGNCGTGGCTSGTCGVGGCQSAACGTCNQSCFRSSLCDPPRSGWTGSIGALFMTRNNPNRLPMFTDTTTPSRRMDASNFDFGMQSGFEASLTRHRALGAWDYELRYFGVNDWDSLQSLRFDGSPIEIANTPPTFISGPRRAVSRYSSELHNFEWNLKRRISDSTRFVFGFRNIQLYEKLATRFRSVAVPAISTEDYVVTTRNRLYGLQVGFDRTLFGDTCYCLEAYGRAGAFANDASQRSALINYLTPVRTFANRDRDTGFSFVNEVGIRGRYQIFNNANLVAGYRGLWVNDVALASDQIAQTSFAGGSNLDNSGRAFFHGGTLGLEFRF